MSKRAKPGQPTVVVKIISDVNSSTDWDSRLFAGQSWSCSQPSSSASCWQYTRLGKEQTKGRLTQYCGQLCTSPVRLNWYSSDFCGGGTQDQRRRLQRTASCDWCIGYPDISKRETPYYLDSNISLRFPQRLYVEKLATPQIKKLININNNN